VLCEFVARSNDVCTKANVITLPIIPQVEKESRHFFQEKKYFGRLWARPPKRESLALTLEALYIECDKLSILESLLYLFKGVLS
jgi:hypothetical protein